MILPCPACQARFMVPDERITPRGIKIRCPKCRFVFIMKAQKRSVADPTEELTPPLGVIAPKPVKKKKKPPRKRLPEAEAAKLSEEEIAAMEEEIVDMDELAQATEQSGTAFNPNIKAEHFQPVAAPSVMIDDSLLSAAAAHSASWTTAPVAADDLPRMSPSAAVSDTWIDLPGQKTPPYPTRPFGRPATVTGSLTSGSLGATSGAITSGSLDSASASGSLGSTSGAIPSAPPAAVEEAWPEPSLELAPEMAGADADGPGAGEPLPDTSDTIPGDVLSPFLAPAAIPSAASLPVAGQAPPARPAGAPSVLGSVIPSAPPVAAADADEPDLEISSEDPEPLEAAAASAPATRQRFEMAYTLSAATSFSAAELAELDEYEGLLVEERRALRKGHAATVLLIVGICLGAAVLGGLAYLGWQVLNPPKKQPPAWGHLQLSRNEHNLVVRKDQSPVVVATVTVKNASTKHKFRNVHIEAKLLSASGEVKCASVAPCGPRFSPEELGTLAEGEYAKLLKGKSRVTAYNVQLNPSQEERCQVVLFCGTGYRDEQDRVQLQVDRERTERLIE